MTTFQDQPPQSRRALRQQELSERARAEEIDDSAEADRVPSGRRARAAASEGLVEVANTGSADADSAVEAPVLTDSAIPKAFPFADQVEATSDDAGHSGFRLHDFNPEQAKDEQAKDEQARDEQAGSSSGEAPTVGYVSPYAEPVASAESKSEPSFDALFSDLLAPEADADVEPEAQAEPGAQPDPAPLTEPVVVDESAVPVGEPIEVAEPVALVAPVEIAQEERTLSRREWRAMRAAAEAAAAAEAENAPQHDEVVADVSSEQSVSDAQPAPAEQPLFQEPDVQPADVQAADEQPADEPAAQTPSAPTVIPPLVEPVAARQTALSDAMAEFEALTRAPQDPAQADNPTVDSAAEPAADEPNEPVDIERGAPAAAEPAKPVTPPTSTPFSFLVTPAAPAATPADDDASAYTPPIGHWSRQAELDDESQPFENTLSRDVGGGNVATTTNALVLPMIPQRDDFSSVLNATGEIMVTGTINLPGSVGTTGRDSRHYDDPEVDHLFDSFDNEIPNTDSAPVRAITAVSSHTATRGGIEPGRKQSNRVLTVLLVTAGVMAVSVLGLLVAGFVFNIF